ncbi:MAG: MaoC family dehydratase [Pseudomonadota bacterium]
MPDRPDETVSDQVGSALVGLMFEDLELGQSAALSKTVTTADIAVFAELSGDNNPVHVNPDYAATTMFKQCIAHGMLTGSLISALFGTRLPGPGAIYISQTFNFRAPVFARDEITAEVEVADLFPAKNRVKFDCVCRNQTGKTVLVGEAILMVPSREAT